MRRYNPRKKWRQQKQTRAKLPQNPFIANCLRAAGITHLRELCSRTESEMLKYRNFGRKSLNELGEILVTLNLNWGMDLTPYDDVEIDDDVPSPLAEEF